MKVWLYYDECKGLAKLVQVFGNTSSRDSGDITVLNAATCKNRRDSVSLLLVPRSRVQGCYCARVARFEGGMPLC